MVLRLPAAITLRITTFADLGLGWDGQCCPAVLSVGEGLIRSLRWDPPP